MIFRFLKIKTVLLTVVLFQNINLKAQSTVNTPSQYENTWRQIQVIRNLLNTSNKSQPLLYEDIKGSPYKNDDFKLGKVYLKDSLLGEFMLRYNLYNDELEVLSNDKNNEEFEIFIKHKDLSFEIDSDKFIVLYLKDDDGLIKNFFFQRLTDKDYDYKLYKRSYSKLSPAVKAPNFNQADKSAKFTTYKKYYIKNKQIISELPTKKKNLFKFFPKYKEKLKSFLKSEKLKLNSDEDFKKLIIFINDLT